jgi:hypothetical protein
MQNFAGDVTGDAWDDVPCMGAIGQTVAPLSQSEERAAPLGQVRRGAQVQKESR